MVAVSNASNSSSMNQNLQLEQSMVSKTPAELYSQIFPGGTFDANQAKAFAALSPAQQQHVIKSLFDQAKASGDPEMAWNALQIYGNLVSAHGPGVGAILGEDLVKQAKEFAANPDLPGLGRSPPFLGPTPQRFQATLDRINSSASQADLISVGRRAAGDPQLLKCLSAEQKGVLIKALVAGGNGEAASTLLNSARNYGESNAIWDEIGDAEHHNVYVATAPYGSQVVRERLEEQQGKDIAKFDAGHAQDMGSWIGRTVDSANSQAAADVVQTMVPLSPTGYVANAALVPAPVSFVPANAPASADAVAAFAARLRNAALDKMSTVLQGLGPNPSNAALAAAAQSLKDVLGTHPEFDGTPLASAVQLMEAQLQYGSAAGAIGVIPTIQACIASARALPPGNLVATQSALGGGVLQTPSFSPTAVARPPQGPFNPSGKEMSLADYYNAARAYFDPNGLVDKLRSGTLDPELLAGPNGQVVMMQIQDALTRENALLDMLRNIENAYNEQIKKTIDAIR
ncbi:MAG: hypothetical protein U1E65_20305 [Myxococcota bacterium]